MRLESEVDIICDFEVRGERMERKLIHLRKVRGLGVHEEGGESLAERLVGAAHSACRDVGVHCHLPS